MKRPKFKEGQMVCRYANTDDSITPYVFIIGHISLIEGNRIHVIWYDADKWRHPSGWLPIPTLYAGKKRELLCMNMDEAKISFNKLIKETQ